MAKLIDGKSFAAGLRSRIKEQVSALKSRGITPGLAVVLVGENPASKIYVRNKHRATVEVGMQPFEFRLPSSTSERELLELLGRLNDDPKVHGILCQLPLPPHCRAEVVINAIRPDKDVDGFNILNVGRLATGKVSLVPCTPFGCLMLLREYASPLAGKRATIVGRSNIVGKPMAQLLIGQNCTVTVAHSQTKDIEALCRQADILVAAVGRPQMITGNWIKEGAAVIDVGINRIPAPERGPGKYRIVGDVHFESAEKRAGWITPVPGGVGPMTIACLLANTTVACFRANRLAEPKGLSI